jgi:PAS domain S-box-containing protein
VPKGNDTSLDKFAALRKQAETLLAQGEKSAKALAGEEHDKLTHELLTRQIELELQNEELRRAQIELEQSHRRYVDLYDFAPVGYLTLSNKGIILQANLTAADMLGVERQDLLHKRLSTFILEEDQEIYDHHQKNIPASEDFQTCELRMRTKEGKLFHVDMKSSRAPVLAGNGQQVRSILVDISDRKTYEESLRRSKEEWAETFDSIDDIITLQDKDMRIVRANKAAGRFFNKDPLLLVGKSCYQLLHEATEPCPGCPLLKAITDKKCHSEIIKHEGSEKVLQINSSLIFDEKGEIRYLIHVARDITEKTKQDLLLLQLRIQQEQAKRLESLKTMAGAIAHRFNNAMTAVLGNLEIMSESLPDNIPEKKMAAQAYQAAHGASGIGTMMLSYVGQRPLQLQTTDLAELTQECATEVRRQFKNSYALKFIPPPEPLYCSLDQQQMKEVISNILANAIEALPAQNGEIEISFGTAHFDRASFPIAFQGDAKKKGRYTFCQVRDTGQGIVPENIPYIFEPFYTTKFVGRGLGLALSLGLIQTHHGAILVKSSPGAGTTVKILLPAMEPAPEMSAAPASPPQKSIGGKLSGAILVVDDDDLVLNVTQKMLEILGFTVYTAVNGLEALEMVQQQTIDFRAVVMDVSMPIMNGIEAMKEMRKCNANLPILLNSGYAEEDFPFAVEGAGKPDVFLKKPFQFAELQMNLEKLLS